MYTRCPSCRSEISFDPPANKDSLPDNYRHRIKCPSCGVTIGVKINQNPQMLSQPMRPQLAAPPGSRPAPQRQAQPNTRVNNAYAQPQRGNAYGQPPRGNAYGQPPRGNAYGQPQRANGYAQQRPAGGYNPQNAYPYGNPQPNPYYEEQEVAQPAQTAQASSKKAKAQTKAKTKANTATEKKSGIGRNLVMMLFSLIFVAISSVAYLISNGTIKLPDSFAWADLSPYFNGIGVWAELFKNFEVFKAMPALCTFATLVPLLLFTLACINFILALVFAILKKYGRVYNFFLSLIIGGCAVTALFTPVLITMGMDGSPDTIQHLMDIIASSHYLAIGGAVFGVLQFVFSIVFLKSLRRKNADAEADTKKGGKSNKNANNANNKNTKKTNGKQSAGNTKNNGKGRK